MLKLIIECCLLFCCFRPFEDCAVPCYHGADGSVMKCGGTVPASAGMPVVLPSSPTLTTQQTGDAEELKSFFKTETPLPVRHIISSTKGCMCSLWGSINKI